MSTLVENGRDSVWLGGKHQDPVTKSQRITDSSGTLTSTIVDLDPWGGETGRSSNAAFQPHRFTSYDRDANAGDDAMMRRYHSSMSRFAQPDPYEGSYRLEDPQSFNRYAYTQNDPVNFVDPNGMFMASPAPPPDYHLERQYWSWFWDSVNQGWPGWEIGGWINGDGGDGLGGQPTQDMKAIKEVTGCDIFAAFVDTTALNSSSARSFLDELARQFTSANNSSTVEMRTNSNSLVLAPRLGSNLSDSGIRPEFLEPAGGQIRHFVGGLIAGFNLPSSTAARLFMNAQEGTLSSTPDTRLNRISTEIGGALRSGQSRLLPRSGLRLPQVANEIRRRLCEPH